MKYELVVNKKHSQLMLGITLRYARLKSGLSLRDLSELANISHTLIANIEKGKIVANSETLKELFRILKIDFRDDDELIQEFTTRYNRIFHHLYMNHLERVLDDIKCLEEQEMLYMNSIVIIDYSLIRFLYAALSDNMNDYLTANLDLLRRVGSLLSPEQQQIRHLILGVDLYNHAMFKDAYEELLLARKIGNANLDPLVNTYIVRCQVMMFMFMDAQQLADQTIKALEEHLNYVRAMDVRLSLAYSHMLVHKFTDAERYLDKVCHYGTEFNEQRLIDRCNGIYGIILILQRRISELPIVIENIVEDDAISILVKIYYAAATNDKQTALKHYNNALNHVLKPHRKREQLFYWLLLCQLKVIEYDEEEYVNRLNKLIECGTEAYDQELLMFGFDLLIEYYKENRKYKKALELSEKARGIRSYGNFNS